MLVVLFAVLVPLSVVTTWSVNTVTNTDHFVATMAPIARDKVITDVIAKEASAYLFEHVKTDSRIAKVLPKAALVIVAPLSAQLQAYTATVIENVLQSSWFGTYWDGALRFIHGHFVSFLQNKQATGVASAQAVAVNLTPVLLQAIAQLDAKGVSTFDPLKAKLERGQELHFMLANDAQVAKVRTAFHLATVLGWALPLVALGIAILALLIGVNRRKVLLRLAAGAALALVVLITVLSLARTYFISHAKKVDPSVSGSLWDILTRFLHNGLHYALIIAIVVVLACWAFGPSRWAIALRVKARSSASWLASQAKVLGKGGDAAPSPRTRELAAGMVHHSSAIRLVGVVVAGAIVVFGGSLSVTTIWVTLLALVLYLVLVELALTWARRVAAHSVEAGPHDTSLTGASSSQG